MKAYSTFYQILQAKGKPFTYVFLLILRLAGFVMQTQRWNRMRNICTQKVLEFLGRLEKDPTPDFFRRQKHKINIQMKTNKYY